MLNKFVYILFAISIIITFSACKGTNTTFPDEFISDESSDSNLDNSENSSSSTKQSSSSEDRDYSSSLASSSSLVSSSSVSESSSSIQSSNSKSSSSECIDTPAEIPSKKYDCSVYKCRSTAYLNPNVDYGELLDERDSTVYRTVKIGNQNWMAQNLAYDTLSSPAAKNEEYYGLFYEPLTNPCPKGWKVPTIQDFDTLLENISRDLTKLRANTCLWTKTEDDPLGFSLLPAGFSWDEYIHTDCGAYLWTSSSDAFSAASIMTKTCPGSISYGYSSSRMSIRCIEGETKHIEGSICNTDSTQCNYGTLIDERDGNSYKTIKIGDMEWMAENLRFADVDSSVKITRIMANKDSNQIYGLLYSMRDTAGICPTGWHIPNQDEWELLYNSFAYIYAGVATGDNLIAKESGWEDPYGFSIRLIKSTIESKYYSPSAYFYESSETTKNNGCNLAAWNIDSRKFYRTVASCELNSVRCVKN